MIREANVLDVLGHIGELLSMHWHEIGNDFELVPNVRLYAEAHRSGAMICLVAEDEGKIVGYTTGILSPHLYNPEIRVCACDAVYVRPEKRGFWSGKLVLEMERVAKERGATHVLWMTNASTKLHAIFERHGYAPADISMMKRLT